MNQQVTKDMCGRYTQKKSKEEVEERFGAAYYKEVRKANLPPCQVFSSDKKMYVLLA